MKVWARVKTKEQFASVVKCNDLFVERIIIDFALACDERIFGQLENLRKENRKFYYQLPDVLRNANTIVNADMIEGKNISPNADISQNVLQYYDGLLIKNLDELGLVMALGLTERKDFEIIGDAFLYAYNPAALALYRDCIPNMKFILSDELNKEELAQLIKGEKAGDFICKAYGHPAVMIAAQCLNKNYGRCWRQKNSGKGEEQKDTGHSLRNPLIHFKDDTGEEFISLSCCEECYSTIYKGETTCILSKAESRFENVLFDFTVENGKETENILKNRYKLAYKGGHFDKGIE